MATLRSNNLVSYEVDVIDGETKKLIKSYPSIAKAAVALGFREGASISRYVYGGKPFHSRTLDKMVIVKMK